MIEPSEVLSPGVFRILEAGMESTAPERLLTTRSAAWVLACSERQVYRLMANGRLPTVRIGRAVRLAPEAIAEFIKQGGAR